MICKYCRRDGVFFDHQHQRYECSRCHLSSRNMETIVFQEPSFDHVPTEDMALEAVLDKDGEPVGFVQRYIPADKHPPDLKVDIERARLLRWLLQEKRREEKEWGFKWLRDNGFEIVDERRDRRKRKVYVWEQVQ